LKGSVRVKSVIVELAERVGSFDVGSPNATSTPNVCP
jgi:hypothetical protein